MRLEWQLTGQDLGSLHGGQPWIPSTHPPAISELDSADIEVTDNRLPNPTFVEHRPQVPPSPPNPGHLPRDWQCMYTPVLTLASSVRDLGDTHCAAPSDSDEATLCFKAAPGLWSVLCGAGARVCRLWPHTEWRPRCGQGHPPGGAGAAEGRASTAQWSLAGEPALFLGQGALHLPFLQHPSPCTPTGW